MNLQKIPYSKSDEMIKEVFCLIKNKYKLKHYKDTESLVAIRLKSLYNQLISCLKYNNISQLYKFAEEIAIERFNSGFKLFEVLTVINIFQAEIWKYVSQNFPQKEILSNIAIISSIFGVFKDEIACTYVKLSANNKLNLFNTESLFDGTERTLK